MSDNRKYYYLKLKENYFDDDSIVLLESMQDGVLYSNILLKLYAKIMMIAGTSFLLETTQYVLAIGRSDITDVLTNTAGGLLGLIVYLMVARLIGNRIKANRLFSILAGIVSVVVIGLLSFILFTNR